MLSSVNAVVNIDFRPYLSCMFYASFSLFQMTNDGSASSCSWLTDLYGFTGNAYFNRGLFIQLTIQIVFIQNTIQIGILSTHFYTFQLSPSRGEDNFLSADNTRLLFLSADYTGLHPTRHVNTLRLGMCVCKTLSLSNGNKNNLCRHFLRHTATKFIFCDGKWKYEKREHEVVQRNIPTHPDTSDVFALMLGFSPGCWPYGFRCAIIIIGECCWKKGTLFACVSS